MRALILGMALGLLGAICLLLDETIPGAILLGGGALLMFYGTNKRP